MLAGAYNVVQLVLSTEFKALGPDLGNHLIFILRKASAEAILCALMQQLCRLSTQAS